MKKLIAFVLLTCMILTLAACGGKESTPPKDTTPESTAPESTTPESTMPEITAQFLYDAGKIPELLKKHDSVYLVHTENGEVYEEEYFSNECYYTFYGYNEYEYALFSTAHSHYMYFEDKYERVIVVSPDGLLDLESLFAEDLDRNIFTDSLLNDTVTSVIEKDGQIIVTSVPDREELDTYEAEGWSLGKEETVLDAKTFDVIFERADYTEIETGEVYEGAINITYDGEIPESMKKFVEYDTQTENMRTVTVVTNPGGDNEKTESLQVPKGLQVTFSGLADEETPYTLYTDAECTQAFEEEADTDSDLTIYVKWGE